MEVSKKGRKNKGGRELAKLAAALPASSLETSLSNSSKFRTWVSESPQGGGHIYEILLETIYTVILGHTLDVMDTCYVSDNPLLFISSPFHMILTCYQIELNPERESAC